MSQDRNAPRGPDYNDLELDPDMADELGARPFADEREGAGLGRVPPSWDDVPAHKASGEPQTVEGTSEELQESSHPCVMLGPARSGKTTLLTAIKRACDQPAEDELNLEFIPHKETAEKIRTAIHKIVERQQGHEATSNVGNYPFDVHVSAKAPNFWSPP